MDLLSQDQLFQNLPTVFNFIIGLGGAVVVILAAIRFVVRPIRAAWINRVQLTAVLWGSAQYTSTVSPRGRTFPRVKVVIQNVSLLRSLPNAQVSVSTLSSVAPSQQGEFKPERTIEVMPPLTDASSRGRNSSEIFAPDNWQLADEFSVTLSWETRRISATQSKRASQTWNFKTSDVPGVRESR